MIFLHKHTPIHRYCLTTIIVPHCFFAKIFFQHFLIPQSFLIWFSWILSKAWSVLPVSLITSAVVVQSRSTSLQPVSNPFWKSHYILFSSASTTLYFPVFFYLYLPYHQGHLTMLSWLDRILPHQWAPASTCHFHPFWKVSGCQPQLSASVCSETGGAEVEARSQLHHISDHHLQHLPALFLSPTWVHQILVNPSWETLISSNFLSLANMIFFHLVQSAICWFWFYTVHSK